MKARMKARKEKENENENKKERKNFKQSRKVGRCRDAGNLMGFDLRATRHLIRQVMNNHSITLHPLSNISHFQIDLPPNQTGDIGSKSRS